MNSYEVFKQAHKGMAYLSISLFILRGVLMSLDSERLHQRYWKILPHVIDALLLAFALSMLVLLWGNPFQYAWLSVKIVAVLVYIALGMLALKGKTQRVRRLAFLTALLVVTYILMVAQTKRVWPF
ncbi:hypothetical protein DTO96_101524 [Ephemeroptericola cinctiostellae]|uniref:Protein YchQ n=1 Tax=Ephemeroptericola cinctiostellae TaxID=2268024 RepID=A0A345DBQ0_9BURK|nr:SirB2 family protein [Ephemeroptericola cinctiostellae]AXF85788.1 hypothetical protein DTO96_101524 [Ephemeroptericola cinctiostellae]